MLAQIFGPIYFKESWPRVVFILGKQYFCKEAILVWYLWTSETRSLERRPSFAMKVMFSPVAEMIR